MLLSLSRVLPLRLAPSPSASFSLCGEYHCDGPANAEARQEPLVLDGATEDGS